MKKYSRITNYNIWVIMIQGNIQLFEWQKQCIDLWFENECRGIASVATGAGKTFFAIAAAERLKNRMALTKGREVKVKIVVPRVFLAKQWRGDIVRFLDVSERDVGLYYGALKADPSLPYMVYVINSARYNIARHIISDIETGNDVLLICDEAHHYGSTENARIFEFMKRALSGRVFTLGLSATPDATHLDDVIVPALGRVFYRFSVGEAIKQNVAMPYIPFSVAVEFTPDERNEYSVYSDAIARVTGKLFRILGKNRWGNLSGLMEQINALVAAGGASGAVAGELRSLILSRKKVLLLAESRISCSIELVKNLCSGNRIILFSERIATANALYNELSDLKISRVGMYHSGMDKETKERALEAYRSGSISILISCRALDEGLNVPDTDVGIIVSSSAGLRQRIQRVGRIIRKTGRAKPKRVYYLYIPGTSEARELLPEDHIHMARQDTMLPSINLSFDCEKNLISNLPYDQIAEKVISDITEGGASNKQIASAQKYLRRGALATDWLLPEANIVARLSKAVHSEKAYLTAMLLMVRSAL